MELFNGDFILKIDNVVLIFILNFIFGSIRAIIKKNSVIKINMIN